MRDSGILKAALVFFGLFLGFAPFARADGMMFPSEPKGPLVEAPPRISSQRAVIKYDGKTETMLIESVLSGPKGRYGWVVPLPKVPSFVKAVKPDYAAGAFELVRPKVRRLNDRDLGFPLLLSALASLLFLSAAYRYRRLPLSTRIGAYAMETFLIAAVLLLQSWFGFEAQSRYKGEEGSAKTDSAPSAAKSELAPVHVLSYGTIGSYEVSVLTAAKGQPVLDWLKKHEIRAPQTALDAMDQYVKDGWCFLAAEFRKDSSDPLPPHPLKAVFDTDKPVYPMRLTATQDGPLHLELIVIGESQAEVPNLKAWSCDSRDLLVAVPKDPLTDKTVFSEWSGSLYAMAKDGQVATYLRGDISPSQMREDYAVSWKPFERFEAEVYDRDEARTHAVLYAVFWMPVAAFAFGVVPLVGGVRRRLYAASAAGALLLGLIPGTTWFSGVERVETEEGGAATFGQAYK